MWKVLLVEDETFVRKKLRKLVHWEELGFTVCGEADNGEDALKQMEILRPDLVLADIAMPVMDGLELLRASQEAGYASKFIMLTCMNEFEYPRQALELGAIGYILKLSMSIAELQAALAKAGAELEKSRVQRELALSRAFEHCYAQALRALHTGESGEACEAAVEAISTVRVSMGAAPLKQVALVTLFGDETGGLAEEWLVGRVISPETCVWKNGLFHNGVTTLFFWAEGSMDMDSEVLEGSRLRGVYSRPFYPRHLLRRWREHLQAMETVWYEEAPGARELMSGHSRHEERQKEGAAVPSWETERRIIAAFEELQVKTVDELLQGYWQSMADKRVPVETVREAAGRLSHMFASIAGRVEMTNSGCGPLHNCRSHGELLAALGAHQAEWAAAMARSRVKLTDHPEINRILEYCRQHYNQNISLKAMATMVRMEEHYLSRLFRQKTNDSLINYVQTLRLDKAKELLAHTSQPVAEIGQSVGFANENYFAKTFRKHVGQTPSQYRKEQLAQV